MAKNRKQPSKTPSKTAPAKKKSLWKIELAIGAALIAGIITTAKIMTSSPEPVRQVEAPPPAPTEPIDTFKSSDLWVQRALAVTAKFHRVYTPCWEGAYGALGDAYLFAATGDSALLRFHLVDHNLKNMCEGRWVDDRAWVCLAELKWWSVTGKTRQDLVADAIYRYDQAKSQGRLSSHEGFWSWYNWPLQSGVNEHIYTNSNMNQMVTVACKLYEATNDRRFLDDALKIWNGDGHIPGIEKTFYRGDGRWEGSGTSAAFSKQLPWDGTGYCSVTAALYKATHNEKYRAIAVATARRIMDPKTGWVAPNDFYQLRMDGSGAFVNFLLDAYDIAPDKLHDILPKVQAMLDHVWTNNHGKATVVLHRTSDDGIRNGWNPAGGEDGYLVGEVGTVHAQGEAARAFGVFAYFHSPGIKKTKGAVMSSPNKQNP